MRERSPNFQIADDVEGYSERTLMKAKAEIARGEARMAKKYGWPSGGWRRGRPRKNLQLEP